MASKLRASKKKTNMAAKTVALSETSIEKDSDVAKSAAVFTSSIGKGSDMVMSTAVSTSSIEKGSDMVKSTALSTSSFEKGSDMVKSTALSTLSIEKGSDMATSALFSHSSIKNSSDMTTSLTHLSIESGSDFVTDFSCISCTEKRLVESAEFFCETCQKLFCRKCIALHDQLFTNHNILGTRQLSSWPILKLENNVQRNCQVHKGEKLEMMCIDHNQLCCAKCAFIHHRHCRDVTLISESVKRQSTIASQSNPDQVFTVVGIVDIDVSIPSDEENCWISAVCVLPDSQILLVDTTNETVKLLDQQYRLMSYLLVTGVPDDMCNISADQVAVTVNTKRTHEVQFITVTNGQLIKGRTLRFDHKCYGIAIHQRDLYIASNIELFKYTMEGTLVSKIYGDTSSEDYVCRCAVNSTGTNIYITTATKNKVLILTMNGTLLATIQDPKLVNARGIHVTATDQILVCGCWSYNVVQVDGKNMTLTVLGSEYDTLGYLDSICYDSNTATIILGQMDNDKIRVLEVA